MTIPFRNIRQLLSLQAKVAPDKVFLKTRVSQDKWEELTYAEFNARAHQAANLLHTDFDVQAGDGVTIIDDEPADVMVLLMACWLIGAVAVPLSAEEPGEVATHQLSHTDAKVCLIRQRYLPDWQNAVQSHWDENVRHIWQASAIVQLGGPADVRFPHFHTLVRSQPNTLLSDGAEPDLSSPALFIPNNSATIFSKVSHLQLLIAGDAFASTQAISGNHRLLRYWPVPDQFQPYYSAAQAINIFIATLLSGASLMLNWRFKPDEFWRAVAGQRLHIACLEAGHLAQLVEFAQQQRAFGHPIYGTGVYQQDIKHLRHMLCSSNGLTSTLLQAVLSELPISVLVGYSRGVTAGFSCLFPWNVSWPEYRHWMFEHDGLCVGCPLDGYEIAIMDKDGSLLTAGEQGELCLRGNIANPADDGWLHTGESAYYLTDQHNRSFVYLVT
ncbi:MAG: AMP-binding protein [Anaerolineae bacterium]